MTTFAELGLAEPLLRALTVENYTVPTPIQEQAIPIALTGRDIEGIAQTGTGKTAAFALPILHRLLAKPQPPVRRACRVLVLAPTRELAVQIANSFRAYGRQTGLRVALMFGGMPKFRQSQSVERGVDILVATPGRLLDHLSDGAIRLDLAEILVLDEADHMLDLGFIIPIRRIAAMLPAQRQTLFFSATMPREIAALSATLLHDPVRVAVSPVATAAERVEQAVCFVEQSHKRTLLAQFLKRDDAGGRTLVFSRTKHGADRIVQHLEASGLRANAIHGDKSQAMRDRALRDFREGRCNILIATDIAARGIDVDGITHVINYDLPNVPESYVHRIGRTARAGQSGIAISFCDRSERGHLRGIEKLIKARISVVEPELLAA